MVVDVGLGTPALRVERVGFAQREEGVSSGLVRRVLPDEAVGVRIRVWVRVRDRVGVGVRIGVGVGVGVRVRARGGQG